MKKIHTMNSKTDRRPLRVIVSGGGTGGHIFPAISIANALRSANDGTEVLFVGAEGRMEMEKVPAAGYEIIGLDIRGIQRKLTLRNLAVPFKTLAARSKAKRIIKEFKPDVVVGVGGYASAPVVMAAQKLGVPTLIQEQNSFAGVSNRLLGKKADSICVAYSGMERFFPAEKIVFTGNPIRSDIVTSSQHEPGRRLLVLGGSLGARSINEAMASWIESGLEGGQDLDIVWQCGKFYYDDCKKYNRGNVRVSAFIEDIAGQIAQADVIVSRAGASTVSELCVARKAVVFVPSPNVAENHQYHNAMALAGQDAALCISDANACTELPEAVRDLFANLVKRERICSNIAKFARPSASEDIVSEIYRIAKQ